MPGSDTTHWEGVYTEKGPNEVSWFEAEPAQSLALVQAANLPSGAAILDVGGGASLFASRLVEEGYTDITVADISSEALDSARSQLDAPDLITWVKADVRAHDFGRQYDLWHDRAVFHFMVETDDQDAYLTVLRRSLRPGGHLIVATFGPDGPERCSGLPVRRYASSDLSKVLGSDFELLASDLAVHETPSGASQQFTYAHFRRT